MPHIIVYSTRICPYCVHAKALLERKGVSNGENLVTGVPLKRRVCASGG